MTHNHAPTHNGQRVEARVSAAFPPGASLNGLHAETASSPSSKIPVDYANLLATVEVKASDPIPRPPVCLTIRSGEAESTVGTLGNFSLLIGRAKSRKTFAVGLAVAAALKGETVQGRFTGQLPPDQQMVLYFDTEQGNYHVQRSIRRICELVGIENPTNLRAYALRTKDTKERLGAIEWAIYNTEGIGLVVIDGIRDVVFDINSPEEATDIATRLLRWTEERRVHVLTVLHQNKGNDDARGHLGTELVNKAETVIRVAKDPEDREVSTLTPEMCRDRDFEPFGFSIDEHGLPVLVEGYASRSPSGKNYRGKVKPTPATFSAEQHEALLLNAFGGREAEGYGETWRRIKRAAEAMEFPFGDNTAKDFLSHYLDVGRVSKEAGKRAALYRLKVEVATPV